MDMKKISKPRMDDYDYERKQRREREKSERQQVQTSSSNREVALFSEPRRVNPSEADDDISAKLGEYSTVKDFINLYTVGISNSGHRHMPPNAILPGIVPTSPSVPVIGANAPSSSSSSSSQRLLPPPSQQNAQSQSQQQQQQQPPHHYQQHQQQLRQAPYVKQADNKPPYNGRGGYPGQPVNRSSSGMAPPKGPPGGVGGALLSTSSSGSLLPPSTTHMPNGRQTSVSASEKSYLGPPVAASTSTQQHNGRFPQPSIPKQRQKHFPPEENDITEIINRVTSTFRPPKMLTGIDATPHNTLMENYNLSEPNKHKYSFDISEKLSMIEPLLDSPPRNDMPAPRFVPPLTAAPPSLSAGAATQMPSTQSASNLSLSNSSSSASSMSSSSSLLTSSSSSSSSSTYIAPLQAAANVTATAASVVSSSIANNNNSNATTASTSSSGQLQQSSSALTAAITSSPTVPLSPLMGRPTKDAGFLKPMKSEKPTPPPLERQNSTLENDLELSESDDDRVKQSCSAVNTSDSSPSDSSESGSESSKSESNQPALSTAHQQLHQQQLAAVLASKKKLGLGSSGSAAGGSISSSGLGSSAPPSGGSSSSSSNKTPSPSNTTKWQLSRYFNKAPLHQTPTQDVSPSTASSVVNSVNSMNVANLNMPITLRGGAQIIPEPPQQLTNIIKNESLLDDQDDDDDGVDDDNENDEDNAKMNAVENRRSSRSKKDNNKSSADTFPHPSLAAATAFPSRKTPASLSVTPLSPMLTDIKKEAATPHPGLQGVGSQQQQVPEFLAMNSNQIKHETMVIAGGHTTVTPYDVLQGFSNLSSDSNSSDEGTRERLPVRGPGGTLQIPGVPAAITALPRSPPIMQKAPIPNTLTMIPIDPLPSSPPSVSSARPISQAQQQTPQVRPRKPRKKLKQAQSAALAPDTSDEEQDDMNKQQRLVAPAVAVVASSLGTTNITAATKKGRGRPRKTTPNQSGNLSSNSSASTSAKGPTLTAKKDINKKPPASTTTPTKPANRKRMSRQNSSNSSAHDTAAITPTKQLQAASTVVPPTAPTQQPLEALFAAATSDDSSSSSDSSSYSNSKTSSSTSDTEIEGRPVSSKRNNQKTSPTPAPLKANTFFSDDDDDDDGGDAISAKQKTLQNQKNGEAKTANLPTTTAPKRIVKKLNTRKSSLEDLSTVSKPNNICLSSASSSSSSESESAEDFQHKSTAQASSNSSLSATQTASTATISGSGSSSQRSVNHQQSPYKVSGPLSNRSRKPTSCSSAFSSESSGEYHSDSDSGEARKEKKLKRDKPKSDKNKISTLTRIFKTSNEGGAKKQGQVMIVDQSEEQQQQLQQQKHISPALRSSQENLSILHHNSLQSVAMAAHSPRLTPGGHTRSPRSLPMPAALSTQLLTAGGLMPLAAAHRTPDRITTSAERKLQQQRIKTPTRTPTRTPPTTRTPTPTPAAASGATMANVIPSPASHHTPTMAASSSSILQPPMPSSLICKIDLSRLLHIPAEWHANNYRLHHGGYHHLPPTGSAGRTPIYDHETILNADLQSCNTQMRLKSTSNAGSGSGTPRSTGNRTPIQVAASSMAISSASDRELSHSRESLHELTKENGNPGRLSSRSTDGSIGGGGTTPKDLSSHLLPPGPPPNGYSNSALSMSRGYASPSTKLGLAGVKHEQIIKHEPDAEYANETKFKSDMSAATDAALIKQELILKQDYKPSDLASITEKSSALCSPNSEMQQHQLDAKPRRKRSTSSSSSPFKEKRRKKEKDVTAPPIVTQPMVTIEKDKLAACIGAGKGAGGDKGGKDDDIIMDALKTTTKDGSMDDDMVHANGQTQKDHHMLVVDQQYLPTNHDRLQPEKKLHSQQLQQQMQQQPPVQEQLQDKSFNNNNSNNTNNNSTSNFTNTASPAHLQNNNNNSSSATVTPEQTTAATALATNATMPPPSNVGLLNTLTSPASSSSSTCTKSPHNTTTTMAQNTNTSNNNHNNIYNNATTICSSTSTTIATTLAGSLSTMTTTTAAKSNSTSSTATATTATTTATPQSIPPPSSSSSSSSSSSQPPPPQVIYRSYFERDDDALNDEFSKDVKFLTEAVHRKHAADREQNTFNQVALYLEAVVYFLLTGAAMEQHSRSEDAAWTIYKDTLSLIKYISSKFRHLQVSSANQHETHNKVAILSLRCQSLISLKLYKLKRVFCRQINNTCTEFFKSGKGDIINGNTPSAISPSNSVGSQGSGSNTPPGKIVPQDIHSALHQQNQFFNYLSSSHELWDQADRLVRQGNHTDFFIALDHENGPLTLHSNVYEVFRYVQAGLKKLKDEMLIQ